jgi:phosphoglycolate phosphatase
LHFCIRAALKALDLADPSDTMLDTFLGAPLPEIFRALSPDISELQVAAAIAAYRQAYDASGIHMNRLYPGVIAMLEAIASIGSIAWIVTSKPQGYAEQVARNLGIGRCLGGVFGAGLDEKDSKTELVARALRGAKVKAEEAMMLGDRFYDIIGARENNVMPVGALWGYGSYQELYGAQCRNFAKSPAEFQKEFVSPRSGYPPSS